MSGTELIMVVVIGLVAVVGLGVLQRGLASLRQGGGAAADVTAEINQLKQRLEAMEQRLEFHDRWLAQHGGAGGQPPRP